MADTPFGDQQHPPAGAGDLEVELDVAAFLPEGVELAGADDEVADRDEVADPGVEPAAGAAGEGVAEEPAPGAGVDLDQLQADLDAVDAAIERLDAGTYGIDAATGELIDDALLAEDPTRLR